MFILVFGTYSNCAVFDLYILFLYKIIVVVLNCRISLSVSIFGFLIVSLPYFCQMLRSYGQHALVKLSNGMLACSQG